MKALSSLTYWQARQLEGVAGEQMLSQTIPQASHQHMEKVIQVLHSIHWWKLATQSS